MFINQHMTQKSEVGNLGEEIATKYLKNKGFLILERNFRKPWGELDIITKYKDGTLVFFEVKTMTDDNGDDKNRNWGLLTPEEQLTKAKLKKLRRTASLYAGENQNLIKDKLGWRIDLVAISLRDTLPVDIDILTNIEKYCEIRHWENV